MRFALSMNAATSAITNARSESINAKIQWLKYTARGFRNRDRFRNAIYFHLGGLDLYPAGEDEPVYANRGGHVWTVSLEAAGAIWGSGTLVAVGGSTCLVEMATLLGRYLSDESCGKTIPCRIGVRRMYEIGTRATTGLARPTDQQLLTDLAADIRDGALCGLERHAPNPFMSGMRYFASEFEDHFARGTCPAGVCATTPALSLSR